MSSLDSSSSLSERKLNKQEDCSKIILFDFVCNSQSSLHSDKARNDHHQLLSLLKKKISTPKGVSFPLATYSSIDAVQSLPTDFFSYEVKILYKYNAILLGGNNKTFYLLDIDTRKVKQIIAVEGLRGNCFHVEECAIDGQDYIYVTSCNLIKYNLTMLIQGKSSHECLVWRSDYQLPNSWGVANFKNDVYVCDFEKGLLRFEKSNGKFISLNRGNGMYGVAFTPEDEMILSHADHFEQRLEIHTMNQNGEWILRNVKKNSETNIFMDPYSIFYEPITQYIYVSDCTNGKIVVLDKLSLNVVKNIEGLSMNYAIGVDKRNGNLYVCTGNGGTLHWIH
ncbi:predicted protein [Naegleria gruberi]|uniref:Predicted protein n=1 Tax=Naegleria gruberi TaxID=5762 RepID=D2VHD1_NAEGR|nr:uncharacterized protein NAEGRDRAFT_68174 [Naegleria gruberi]EFC43780.1 predicted protein [Naegleria gruberi]|eukprot:XP_002676524.1 predicted protein [Naegleria gruberi strain NEG-M]